MNGLSLFSGIGGLDVALSNYVRTVAYCEIDPYCQSVLLQRMQEGHLSKAPIWDDIRTLNPKDLEPLQFIFGGFPCQDISCAGTGKGLAGERSGLFFEIVRLCNSIKPRFIFLENVPAITSRGGTAVVRSIAKMGYDCRWCVISASSLGAVHRRERWFLLANAKSERLEGQWRSLIRNEKTQSESSLHGEDDGHTLCQSSEQTSSDTITFLSKRRAWGDFKPVYWPFESRTHWQEVVGSLCRVDDGISHRVDRLRSLGNAVVPIQARHAFEVLMGIK